jgi:hypothetical protein
MIQRIAAAGRPAQRAEAANAARGQCVTLEACLRHDEAKPADAGTSRPWRAAGTTRLRACKA